MDMDPYSSSGEKLNIKTRKPYTITKQRERWTEEEHNSFLEALKLYGRAWQRIEEHIGTKTAVQIRSHAQKFFTKLEKEAVTKGVSTRQALDLEIPPPRPKRKPNYPYPRKPTNQPTSQSAIQILPQNAKTSDQVENQDPSLSSENENSIPRSVAGGVFRDLINLDETTNQSYITTTTSTNHHKDNTSLFDFPESQNNHGVHNYPRHVPVQVVDGNQGTITGEMEMEMEMSTLEEKPEEVHNHNPPSLSVNIPSRSSSYHHPTIPTFHHPLFTPFSDNQENYRSFLHVSSTISSLIVSSLLQNPAAHAAATYAAKFWHPGNTEASSGDSPLKEQLNPETPSMAAIAAATVAAATAWWAAHGLLPVCTPFYPPFPFTTTTTTPVDGNQAADNNEREKTESSSDEKLNTEPNSNPDDDTKETTTTVDDSSKPNVRKQVDRSSCGSNTTSSSEIETDALEKNTKEKEEIKGSDAPNLANNDSNSRIRVRSSTINPNESWKEVSEEGRLAFQALFSRQVLPQSFSNRHKSELDLNMNMMSRELLRGEKNEEGLLTIGLGSVKLNVHHTGFKPYKRCSMENSTKIVGVGVGPSPSTQNDDDKGTAAAAKRMRFEAEAST